MMGHRPTSEFCRKNMAIINELLRYIDSGDKDVMRIFWAWVYNRRVTEEGSCPAK
jgi:hypothetical protein